MAELDDIGNSKPRFFKPEIEAGLPSRPLSQTLRPTPSRHKHKYPRQRGTLREFANFPTALIKAQVELVERADFRLIY